MHDYLINDVTLLAVATQEKWYNSTLKAIDYCLHNIHFKHVKFLSCKPSTSDHIEYIPIPTMSGQEYSIFMVLELHKYVHTPHVLYIHDDGFIINPNAWTDNFLQYDYIGAPWPEPHLSNHNINTSYRVGNGGFSLRSKKLLDILTLNEMTYQTRPEVEDVFICTTLRPSLESKGIKFAPPDVAAQFSFELSTPENQGQTHSDRHSIKSFGFHARYSDALKFLE